MTSSTLDKPTLILPPHAKDATRPEPTRGHEMFGGVESRRHSVVLAVPGNTFDWGMADALMRSSLGQHDVTIRNGRSGVSADDMNCLWATGLNMARYGRATHFAMLHADVCPAAGWLDVLLTEMDRLGADLVSAIVPIKDARGLTTSGVGDASQPWSPYRRLTMKEAMQLPKTCGLGEMLSHWSGGGRQLDSRGKYLLFNTGCWVADLRNPKWFTKRPDGTLVAEMRFPIRIVDAGDLVVPQRESEDWYFSRMCHELDLSCYVTRKVKLTHVGPMPHPNYTAWGEWEHDQETAEKWAAEEKE